MECKVSLRSGNMFVVNGLNRNIVECKAAISFCRLRIAQGLNRNIVECKVIFSKSTQPFDWV